jgi:hypothetical protein
MPSNFEKKAAPLGGHPGGREHEAIGADESGAEFERAFTKVAQQAAKRSSSS